MLFDQLEWQTGRGRGVNLDSRRWIGRDRDRLWFRARARRGQPRRRGASARALRTAVLTMVGRGRRRSAGLRPGPAQTWAAFGVRAWRRFGSTSRPPLRRGLGSDPRAFEVEYELLLTNRLVLQPLVEAEFVRQVGPRARCRRRPDTTDAGFRVRYECRREFAPYVGVTWSRKWGRPPTSPRPPVKTGGARFVTGLRLWF